MFRMSLPFAIIPAVIAIAVIYVIIKNWIGPSLECSRMAVGACIFLFITLIRFGSGGELSAKKRVNFELTTSAISNFPINIDLTAGSRLAPNYIVSMMPCTIGISWCRLMSAT